MDLIDNQSRIITISEFHSTKLNNSRNIYIYLPPGYDTESDKRYPVLYMQDGQNIFDSATSSSGVSWEIHKTADQLISEGKIRELMIVGVAFKDRTREYSHDSWNKKHVEWNEYAHFEYSVEGKGELYQDFLMEELKPYIDRNYRTLPDKDNTALMGASSGGLVTLGIGIRRPDVFGMLGIISPAFFGMDLDILRRMDKAPLRMWFETGEKEPCLMEDTKQVVELLMAKGYVEGKELIYYEVPDGFHSEKDWGERAAGPLIFFFGSVGDPISTKLMGRKIIGLDEDKIRINPVVSYHSGLIRSDLSASYAIEDPGLLKIMADGTIIPQQEGTTRVEYTLQGIKASSEYTIVRGLSKTVNIRFEVKVPDDTPEDAIVFVDTYSSINLPMERLSNSIYRGVFRLPRGLKVNYKLKMMVHNKLLIEKGKDLQDISFRQLHATEDSEIHFVVDNWGTS